MTAREETGNVLTLMPWDRSVRRALSRQRFREILARKDADEVIRGMTALDAYYTVKLLGVEDAGPMLALLGSEQVAALFDLDVWRGDHFSVSDVLVWLAALAECGNDVLSRAIDALDVEFLGVLLRRRLWVVAKPKEDDEVEVGELPDWFHRVNAEETLSVTRDGRFLVAARRVDELDALDDAGENEGEGGDDGHAHGARGRRREVDEEERKAVLALVDALYSGADAARAARLLAMAASDLTSSLEEDALRFRTARLEDLGFPSVARAIEIYGPVVLKADAVADASPVEKPVADLELPVLHVTAFQKDSLLRDALGSIESLERVRRLESELTAAANAALVADRVEPGDAPRLREVLTRVRGYLNLALGHAPPALEASSDVLQIAKRRLETESVRDLFREGYSRTLARGTKAKRIAAFMPYFTDDERTVLTALLLRRPMFPTALDGARRVRDPDDDGQDPRFRAFQTEADLRAVDAILEDLEHLSEAAQRLDLVGMSARLPLSTMPPANERSFELLLVSLAAVYLVRGCYALVGLRRAELSTLRDALRDSGRIEAAVDGLRSEGGAVSGPAEDRDGKDGPGPRPTHSGDEPLGEVALGEAVARRVRSGLARLAVAFEALDEDAVIDPRFVAGVLVDLS